MTTFDFSANRLTEALAEFVVRSGPFPKLALQRACDAMTDCYGCALAGSREPLAGKLAAALALGGGRARLIGSDLTATAPEAALWNGTVSHAIDYDDTNHPAYAHPSAVLLPAILAISAETPVSGASALDAYVVGLQVFGRLGRAINPSHYKHGWHATSSFGGLAAAAAAARAAGLEQTETATALGIAASGCSGLRANFGTMTKPLHAGMAARAGVLGVLLAREGFTANPAILEFEDGYLDAFSGAEMPRLQPLGVWDDTLEILSEYGLALKPFPSCGATHPGIEAALQLRKRLSPHPDSILAIRLGVSRMAFEPLMAAQPRSGLQAKFSLHYCVAAALIDGRIDRSSFNDGAACRAETAALISRTVMEEDSRVCDDAEFATVVRLEMSDGTSHEELVPLAMGKPARWFSRGRLLEKFLDCTESILEPAEARSRFDRLQSVSEVGDFSAIA